MNAFTPENVLINVNIVAKILRIVAITTVTANYVPQFIEDKDNIANEILTRLPKNHG